MMVKCLFRDVFVVFSTGFLASLRSSQSLHENIYIILIHILSTLGFCISCSNPTWYSLVFAVHTTHTHTKQVMWYWRCAFNWSITIITIHIFCIIICIFTPSNVFDLTPILSLLVFCV